MKKKLLIIIGIAAALVLASSAFASVQLRGKIPGVFVRNAYDGTIDQSGLKRYISTRNVWCAWSNDGHVIVHVTMHNGSAEHVTVNWYPRYAIRAGGIHGDGFSAAGLVPPALPDDRERLSMVQQLRRSLDDGGAPERSELQ